MAKFKIISRDAKAAAKPAAAGSTQTGAKVVKTKKGRAPAGPNAAALTGVRIGVTSGMSIAKYQNKTILDNAKAKLTDEQLAMNWRSEFPNAKAEYTAETVRSVRGLVNRGKHGNDAPSRAVPEFNNEGEAVVAWGEKTAAKRAATSTKASATDSDAAPAVPARAKVGKTATLKKKANKR